MTGESRGIELPALDGREPLGFLAALGLLRLVNAGGWGLSWDPATALVSIYGPDSIDEVRDRAVAAVRETPPDDLLPGLPAAMVPPRSGESGPDPARIDIASLRRLSIAHSEPPTSEWVSAIWTDLADDNEGRCARTPFNSPAGKQTLSTMFVKARDAVGQDPDRFIGEALCGWMRHAGFTGEGLDSRALRDASELPDKVSTYGVPGATYLALMALPFFRVGGAGTLSHGAEKLAYRSRRTTVGWYRNVGERGRRQAFGWPLWSRPLDEDAIGCLLDHPEVASAVALASGGAEKSLPSLAPLGVWAIGMAARRPAAAGKSEGYLAAAPLWRPARS